MGSKNLIIALLLTIIILVVGGGFFLYSQKKGGSSSSDPTETNTGQNDSGIAGSDFCTVEDLSATIQLSPGAGNVYGTLTLTNTSGSMCQINGNEFVHVNIPSTVTNVHEVRTGSAGPSVYQLQPGESLYGTIHYPNGPQCSSNVTTPNVTFSYLIAPDTRIVFENNGTREVQITACQAPSDITEIQVSSLTTQQPNE